MISNSRHWVAFRVHMASNLRDKNHFDAPDLWRHIMFANCLSMEDELYNADKTFFRKTRNLHVLFHFFITSNRCETNYLLCYPSALIWIRSMWSSHVSIFPCLEVRTSDEMHNSIASAFLPMTTSDCLNWFSPVGQCALICRAQLIIFRLPHWERRIGGRFYIGVSKCE